MRVCIAQYNPLVGDVTGQTERVIATVRRAAGEGSDLVIFPELYIVGYPPKDLLERDWFVAQVQGALERFVALSAELPETGFIVGMPRPNGVTNSGKRLVNAAVLFYRGQAFERRKALLPTYDVFDESRYFAPAHGVEVLPFKGERLGLHVCEDAWTDPALWPDGHPYDRDPVADLAAQGATLLVNISASPYSRGKERIRYALISGHARRHGVPFIYVNQVGGNDELLFDGRSLVVDGRGAPVAVLPSFQEALVTVEVPTGPAALEPRPADYTPEEEIDTVYRALVMGTQDYARKTGFTRAVIAVSGGIDSAVTACIAAAALGPENVLAVSMPSRFSSQGSKDDARSLAENLGIEYIVIPIAPAYDAYLGMLEPHFQGRERDTTEENLQARIRGNMLMAISNKFGHLVLSTGNKSELAVGYCTLYGDMSGGLAVISDVPKLMVYELARYINREREIIPQNTITKPPSAELRPNQTDQDTLPPYEVLDPILQAYIEEGDSVAEIVARGFDEATVRWVVRAVDRNEYKRWQAAPGLRVTSKAFGFGRRMPIAARVSP